MGNEKIKQYDNSYFIKFYLIEAKTIMTGGDSAGNHGLLMKMDF